MNLKVEEFKLQMGFGDALLLINQGFKVQRKGWNGKGMFLFPVVNWTCNEPLAKGRAVAPFIAMKTADDKIVPWLASQTDVLATDWERV